MISITRKVILGAAVLALGYHVAVRRLGFPGLPGEHWPLFESAVDAGLMVVWAVLAIGVAVGWAVTAACLIAASKVRRLQTLARRLSADPGDGEVRSAVRRMLRRGHAEPADAEAWHRYASRVTQPLLAVSNTVAAVLPLVGLAGTTLGLIAAFSGAQAGVEGADAVARGISQALETTAVGLAGAIPAAVALEVLRGVVRRTRLVVEDSLSGTAAR